MPGSFVRSKDFSASLRITKAGSVASKEPPTNLSPRIHLSLRNLNEPFTVLLTRGDL
jgi:hypothetical protein